MSLERLRVASRWHVSVTGRRDNYLLPVILHRQGVLSSFSTDYWIPPALAAVARRVSRRLGGRSHPDLATARVRSAPLRATWAGRLAHGSVEDHWIRMGRLVAEIAAAELRADTGVGRAAFGYTGAARELFQTAGGVGALKVYGQVDPGQWWYEMRAEEALNWGCPLPAEPVARDYARRLADERDMADIVVVNSAFVADVVRQEGVREKPVIVMPLAYQGIVGSPTPRSRSQGAPFRAVFVGRMDFAKGFPYFAEAARMLEAAEPGRYSFEAAGHLAVPPGLIEARGWPVVQRGYLRGAALEAFYDQADVLVFPTLGDGFGMVQLEAMARGVPVIATDRCAAIVEDGVSGFVVPAKAAEAIAARVRELAGRPKLLVRMSEAARARVGAYSLTAAAQAIFAVESAALHI